jgi:membrane protease YdiL (CAAX protease family)
MNARMATDARAYRNTLLTLWVVLSAIAYFYSKQQNIPTYVAVYLSAAYMVELAFYLAPGFNWSRALVDSIEPPPVRAFILMLSGLVPYAIYAFGTGTFHWRSFLLLAVICTVVCAWFIAFNRPLTDILFVVVLSGLVLSDTFNSIYITLARKADAGWLGRLMLVHTGAFAVISIRKMGNIGFGFIPATRDWIIGILCFGGVIPAILAANMWLHLLQFRVTPGPWYRVVAVAIGTFFLFLWTVTLMEEFAFRGILQQVISKKTGAVAGLLITSVLFGLVHLPFAHKFPNWPHVVVATILGLFCGIAYMRAGNIRAAAVTHALAVAAWRTLFA